MADHLAPTSSVFPVAELALHQERICRGAAALRAARTALESAIDDGRWHQVDLIPSEAAEWDGTELKSALEDWAAFRGVQSSWPPSVQPLLAAILEATDLVFEDGAHLEQLWAAVQWAAAFADPSGERCDSLLREIGIETPTPEHREAVFYAISAVLRCGIHRAWLDNDRETPRRLRERLTSTIYKETKKLLVRFGGSQPIVGPDANPNGDHQLGFDDRDRLEVDRRAAQRLSKTDDWLRRGSDESRGDSRDAEGDPLDNVPPEAAEPDATEVFGAFAPPDQDEMFDRVAETAASLGTLAAFCENEASGNERALLKAFLDHGGAAEALRAVGDPGNWPRWQSLQRKLRRRR